MRHLLLILFTALIVASCGNRKTDDNETPVITVTIEPQRYFAEAIAGDRFRVETMVPKGSSPETYDPTPRQLINLARSKAYLRIGYLGFETSWMDKLTSNAPDMKVFNTSKGVELIADTRHDHDDADACHHDSGVEPHIWTSTRNAIIIAANTYNALVELDSDHTDYYKARYDSLCRTIIQTDSIIMNLLDIDGRQEAFMIYHPALTYFARDYGLTQISIEEGGKTPSPTHLKELIESSRSNNVKVIFVQPEFDKRNAEVIAGEAGIKIVPINPLSYDWRSEMINVARALSDKQ